MDDSTPYASLMYRFRWPLAGFVLLLCFGLMGAGMARVTDFSERVDSLAEEPPEAPEPKVFDARLEIWFDKADPGLETYFRVEDQFIPEDAVFIAFEELDDPWGVFGEGALETIARLTEEIEQVPYVRHVRSLTRAPWIRWGEAAPGEEGLLVTDLFEDVPGAYSREGRLERMIAILGAQRAASLAGEEEVRRFLGPDADFSDHIGEPRLVDGVVSSDGRTAAIQVQLLRPRPPPEELEEAFGADRHASRVAVAMHANEAQWKALDGIQRVLEQDDAYEYHITGMPPFMRNFMEVGMADMKWVGVMFVVLAVILFVVYRRFAAVGIPILVVTSAIMGMMGAVFLAGDLLNNITTMVPHIVVAVGIADAVHLVTSYYALRRGFTDKRALILQVVKRNALPVFLTTLTTAVAFFSLATSTLDPLTKFGYTGGLGVIFAYVVTMTIVPAFLSLLPLPRTKAAEAAPEDASAAYWTDRFVRFAARRRSAIIVATLGVLAVGGIGLSRIDLNGDFRDWFPEDNRVIHDLHWVEDHLGGMGDLEIVFTAPGAPESDADVAARRSRLEELELQQLLHDECDAATGAAEPSAVPGDETAETDAPDAEPGDAADELAPTGSPSEDETCPPGLGDDQRAELEKLREAEARHQRRRIAVSREFLGSVERFDQRVRAEMADPESPLSLLTNVESGIDVLRKIHQVQNQNRAAYYRVPHDDDVPAEARKASLEYDDVLEEAYFIPAQDASSLAAQYYVQYENGAKPAENLSTLISPDRHTFRIAARIAQAPSSTHAETFDHLRRIAATDFPELAGTSDEIDRGEALASMELTGKLFMLANMSETLVFNFVVSVSLTLVAITLLIMLVYRSVILGLISIVPNALPLVIPLSAFGLLGLYLDGPAIVVAAIALGVCVDDTIHVLTKFQSARKAGLDSDEALLRAFRQTGNALTFTTIILIVGFSVMLFSSYHPNILIGALASTMIALAWLAEFVITPALLSFVRPMKKN